MSLDPRPRGWREPASADASRRPAGRPRLLRRTTNGGGSRAVGRQAGLKRMEQLSRGIPERHGTELVRWSARLVLFLLAAGVLLLLGDGRANAAPSQHQPVAVSVGTPRGAPARVTGELVSRAKRAAGRRPAGAHRRAAVPRRHFTATTSAPAPARRSLGQGMQRAGRSAGRMAQRRTRGSVGRAFGGAARRVDAALAPVMWGLGPILSPVGQPAGVVLHGPPTPLGVRLDLTRPPGMTPGASPAPARAHGARDPARGGGPAAVGTVLLTGNGLAGSSAAARRVAIDTATGRKAGPGRNAPTRGIPAIPASAQATRDTPPGSLASALLPLLPLLLWSVAFGKDGTRHRARPPLLFPA
jgi:hypothetical protein